MYVNADSVEWRPLSADPDAAYLAGALTHELAHVHGMLHPCEIDGVGGAPACSSSAEYLDSVLYPIHREGPPLPSADDVAGTCALYPSSVCEWCAVDEVCVDGTCEPVADYVECPGCSACLEPSDCGDEMTCRYGRCEALAELGHSCSHDFDCRSELCERGRCTRPCGEVEHCPNGLTCEGSPPRCVATWGLDRSTCASGDECRGGLCLEPAEGGDGHCTNACGSDDACVYGEACREVDGTAVCVPMTTGGGCSVGGEDRAPFAILIAISVSILALRRRCDLLRGSSR